MNRDSVAAQAESIRAMGRNMASAPMHDLEAMSRAIGQVELTSGAYGAFGLLGGSLGQALDEVKTAALKYLSDKRDQVADIHDRAYSTANGYVDGDASAAGLAADMPADPRALSQIDDIPA
ncbi:hypothetical protein FE391_30150 [Nonomuraea sp. KC401]|uniref:hypothetical protein n=1 Tax=unclassified Nonomuraea TaxID=2593643 RepID=UPI0010FDADB8|nr:MULTISPECIES: hypothetical protein [unclassified Nonomuraea]NBE97391.1 hypothetical protein [Nonomuraea sp. K271]TLF62420.1 hypothetical protein FE391_30150 [Nonomuraea sp. KC401]